MVLLVLMQNLMYLLEDFGEKDKMPLLLFLYFQLTSSVLANLSQLS